MIIKSVSAKAIFDSRKAQTIEITIITDAGKFSASAPTGKSTGKFEVKAYKKDLEGDIKKMNQLSDYFSDDFIEKFEDLSRIEDIIDGQVGGNTYVALEYATLKALAAEQKKEIWQLINPKAKSKIRFIGNCVGGGKHSLELNGNKPDFQEFLLIADEGSAKKNYAVHLEAKKMVKKILMKNDGDFASTTNDEDAWMTSLNEKQVIDILLKTKLKIGVDIAAAGFYSRKKYHYMNPMLHRTDEEQLFYLTSLIKNTGLFYIEDPFDENDFDSFAKLLKKCPNSLIVGDDLTVTNSKRLLKALEKKSINAIIIKPNQCGSLLEIKRVVNICNDHNIKMIFSHRSGETNESILADLAYGFGADFIKCGITGPERECKIKRLIEIEKSR